MVRQIMVDLETGDFCQKEKQSYLRDIENLRKLISIREKEHENTEGRLNDCQGIVKEKDLQIKLKEDEIKALKKEKGAKFWNGVGIGAGSSLAVVVILLLL
jgi:phosphatidate phosphatase PAH1